MRQIKNHSLAMLLTQLRFTPQTKRGQQLDAAEKLLAIIAEDKEYPFEFVFYKITGFGPKGLESLPLIKGDDLANDLRIFIAKLSGQIAKPVAIQNEKIYSIEELADELDVSAKTINRWRQKGLTARKYVFEDNKKRFGFSRTVVDKFLEKNPKLTAKARSFERLTKKQKEQIIKYAAELMRKNKMSRHQAISRIADKIGKAHETVRYTILKYEQEHPKTSLANHPLGALSGSMVGEVYKLFKQGTDVDELMKTFGRSQSSIYRIIKRRKAKAILTKKIEFIDSDEFLEAGAEEKILAEPLNPQKQVTAKSSELSRLTGSSLDEYYQTLKDVKLLNRDREIELFRRYNYLKYLAYATRAAIKLSRVPSSQLRKIENYLTQAEIIKKMIIEANLRLVVSIAGKHVRSGAGLSDLVSEGNFSLMRAVEKFDYTRGVRFASYATWAIAKDFARKIPAETQRPDKASAVSMANVHRNLRTPEKAPVVIVERARQNLIRVIEDNLNEQEKYIILNHFGLVGTLVRRKKMTLKQIGEEMELSKERIRQIELVALQKLKHFLSIEELELLTG